MTLFCIPIPWICLRNLYSRRSLLAYFLFLCVLLSEVLLRDGHNTQRSVGCVWLAVACKKPECVYKERDSYDFATLCVCVWLVAQGRNGLSYNSLRAVRVRMRLAVTGLLPCVL